MTLPAADTPLYSHPLHQIEQWLSDLGCRQNKEELHSWSVERPQWKAEISLEREELTVKYLGSGEDGDDINRAFKYSLSRQDIEDAVFSGP
jgi:hypothetical protein